MNWYFILKKIGILLIFLSLTMILPLCCSIYYNDESFCPILKSIIITVLMGIIIYIFFDDRYLKDINQREGVIIVSISWVIISFFGALPFYLSSDYITFVDAFFESVSAFTTTGATIFLDIESKPKGLLLWRSFMQWLGGMGIIVFSIAILPFMKVTDDRLYRAEVPTPVPDRLKPKIRDTAIVLLKIYLFFSILIFILLIISDMNLFDAVCHTLTTVPSGGFSTMNMSIGYFNSLYIDIVILIFMIFSGINFSLHYQVIKGDYLSFWKDSECKFFLLLCLSFGLIVTLDLYNEIYNNILKSFQCGFFQVISILTTTGYVRTNYELWPPISKFIIVICMIIGGSAGSTSGGIKCLRLILCFKYCYRELFSVIHPRAIKRIKINNKVISEEVIRHIIGFLILYLILFVFSSFLLVGIGVDLMTACSAVAASIGNVGPGFGFVGPTNNYALIPSYGKCILSWCMLLGRLEIYTLIIILAPEFWKK